MFYQAFESQRGLNAAEPPFGTSVDVVLGDSPHSSEEEPDVDIVKMEEEILELQKEDKHL